MTSVLLGRPHCSSYVSLHPMTVLQTLEFSRVYEGWFPVLAFLSVLVA